MRLVVLGSGTSFGVPVIGCHCPVCTSDDPRNRRTRTAAVVQSDTGERLLIDTPPELRLQMVANSIDSVDAVLFTHEHADHVHGIDDLRAISDRRGSLPLYGPPATIRCLELRFRYIFDQAVKAPSGTSKPQLTVETLEAYREASIAGFGVLPISLDHGDMTVYGYRIGNLAYVTDAKTISEAGLAAIEGVHVLVLNALFERPHPTHLSIPEAVDLARRVGAGQTFLTHLTHKYAHQDLVARLPDGVSPAFDGLTVEF